MIEFTVEMSLDQDSILLKTIDHPLLMRKEPFPRAIEHIFENSNNLQAVISTKFKDFPKNE